MELNWKNQKFWMVVIATVFLSSTFYGAITSSNRGGNPTVTASIGVDFGGGKADPKTYQVPNETALELFNRTVRSLRVKNGEVICVSNICENGTKGWNFYVNYRKSEKEVSRYYPQSQDLLVLRFENRTNRTE